MPHSELRYRIADAINEAIKKVPGAHWLAKTLFLGLTRFLRKTGSRRSKHVLVARRVPSSGRNIPRQKAEFAICTIIANNYLSMARVLAESFHVHHPHAPVFVLVLDSLEGQFEPLREPFLLIEPAQLDVHDLQSFFFKYNILEASTAIKPYLLAHLLEGHEIQKLIYFDPDILILRGLQPLLRLLDQASVVLTPHITKPYDDQAHPGELNLLASGSYNLGFLALRNDETVKRLLAWWQDRVYHHARAAIHLNLFVDQKWMDLVPGLYENVHILREPGYNVAYWNLHEREISVASGDFRVNGEPGYFFHFSGFDPNRPQIVSKHQNRFTFEQIGEARKLFDHYRERLLAQGWQQTHALPYAYDYYETGEAIPPVAREEFWELGADASISSLIVPAIRQPEIASLPPGINVAGYVSSEKGVGEAMRASLRSIRAAGMQHVVNNFVDSGSRNIDSQYEIVADNPYRVNLVCVNADQVSYFARKKRGYFAGHYNIGVWNWELSSFPAEWRSAFQPFNEIWAPSTFVQQALVELSPIPVIRMPYAVDLEALENNGWNRSSFAIPEDKFVFLFSFDFYSYMERKNPCGLIRAFKKAFGDRSEVLLVIKHSHADAVPDAHQRLLEVAEGHNILLLDRVLPRAGVVGLMNACDSYVSLHRSEGFGLTLTEAMTLGKPVIATGYSSNTDFMDESNSFPVRYKLVELQRDHGPYKKGQVWADPEIDHAAQLMHFVYCNRTQADSIAQKGKEDVFRTLSPSVVGKTMRNRLVNLGMLQNDGTI
jgi:hypothetical protein